MVDVKTETKFRVWFDGGNDSEHLDFNSALKYVYSIENMSHIKKKEVLITKDVDELIDGEYQQTIRSKKLLILKKTRHD